jgi:transcriptional regulator with XRE-family HTH domain
MLVQRMRLQRGWSQQQLADLSGLSVRTIQRIERGDTPSTERRTRLGAWYRFPRPARVRQTSFSECPMGEGASRKIPGSKTIGATDLRRSRVRKMGAELGRVVAPLLDRLYHLKPLELGMAKIQGFSATTARIPVSRPERF